jgi:NAD(P)H-nitrite reductase large subunit
LLLHSEAEFCILLLSLKWYDAGLQGIVAASNCAGKYKEYPGSYQLTALNLPGIDAISMGSSELVLQTSGFREFRTVEWVNRKYYCWLILGDARLLGAQLAGDVQYGGAALSVMMRKDNLRNAKDLVASRRLPVISLMRLVSKYMGQDLCGIDSKVPSELI